MVDEGLSPWPYDLNTVWDYVILCDDFCGRFFKRYCFSLYLFYVLKKGGKMLETPFGKMQSNRITPQIKAQQWVIAQRFKGSVWTKTFFTWGVFTAGLFHRLLISTVCVSIFLTTHCISFCDFNNNPLRANMHLFQSTSAAMTEATWRTDITTVSFVLQVVIGLFTSWRGDSIPLFHLPPSSCGPVGAWPLRKCLV